MSRRYWLPILAAFGLILSVQQSAQAQGSQHSAAKAQTTPKQQAQPTVPPALQNSLDGIRAALEAANKKETPKDETERAKQDLAAQLVMARAAERMFYVGLAETIITFFGVMLVLATLIYTKKAADAARDAVTKAAETMEQAERHARQELRAYVGVVQRESTVPNENGRTRVTLLVKNSGTTPAYGFHQMNFAWVDTYPVPTNRPTWRTHKSRSGKICLDPGQQIRRHNVVKILPEDEMAIRKMKKALWCCGMVHYKDAFGFPRKTIYEYFTNGSAFFDDTADRRLWIGSHNNKAD